MVLRAILYGMKNKYMVQNRGVYRKSFLVDLSNFRCLPKKLQVEQNLNNDPKREGTKQTKTNLKFSVYSTVCEKSVAIVTGSNRGCGCNYDR